LIKVTNKAIPIRMEPHEEFLGADFVEHLVRRRYVGISRTLSKIGSHPDVAEAVETANIIGQTNPGKYFLRFISKFISKYFGLVYTAHDSILMKMREHNVRRWSKVCHATETFNAFKCFKKGKKKETSVVPEVNTGTTDGHFNYMDYLGAPPPENRVVNLTSPLRPFESFEAFHYTNELNVRNVTRRK
jgi:hypothetical protein